MGIQIIAPEDITIVAGYFFLGLAIAGLIVALLVIREINKP